MSEYILDMGNSSYQSTRGLLCADVSQLREEIVRCRDCEHYEPNTYSHFTCELLQFHVEPDGFCAWGERKSL